LVQHLKYINPKDSSKSLGNWAKAFFKNKKIKKTILITTLLIAAMGMNSCKDKCPEPEADINDLLGTWVSLDTFTARDWDGTQGYSGDTLNFFIIDSTGTNYLTISRKGKFTDHYTFNYYGEDSLFLYYLQGYSILLPSNGYYLKARYTSKKDTVEIDNIKKIFPRQRFDRYRKIK
jgi:hypothetical protein